jgi:nicotinate-nucleotide adenylyltransferase
MSARIGLLGGSFDPIHYGHLAIAEEARLALQLEQVLFIPAAQQPFKLGQHAASAEDRLAMVQLACADNPAFEVSAIELERAGPSYTAVTLAALRERTYAELFLILGADSLADLPRWYQAARVVALAQIVAVGRPGAPAELERVALALPGLAGRLTWLDGPNLSISSTQLRERAAAGRSLRYLAPDPVVDFIQTHRPY